MKETIDQKLAALILGRLRQVSERVVQQAEARSPGSGEFLDHLLAEAWLARQENPLKRNMKAAGFPYLATTEQCDCSLRPALKRPVLLRFFDSRVVPNASSLLLLGPDGLGTPHLATAVGTTMVQVGASVRCVVAHHLANAVLSAAPRDDLPRLIAGLIRTDLLILDACGSLTLDPNVGPVLDEMMAGRSENGATMIPSNTSLASWGELVGDHARMRALVDRLLHHGEGFDLRGHSSRMRGKETVAFTPDRSDDRASRCS